MFSNQSIELKTPHNKEQDNVKGKVNDYYSTRDKVTYSAKNESVSQSDFDTVKVNNSEDKDKKTKENALELEDAVQVFTDFMQLSTKNVNFHKDETSEKTVIKVFDSESNDLIKQFPSEEVIDIAHKILELRQDIGLKTGILLDEQV
jgi:flagellar protein FlaG